jgi:hypothetical protein
VCLFIVFHNRRKIREKAEEPKAAEDAAEATRKSSIFFDFLIDGGNYVGRNKGKNKVVMTDVEARKMCQQKERKEFWLQQVEERAFPEERKCKTPVEDLQDDDGELEEEQAHGKVPCDTLTYLSYPEERRFEKDVGFN